MINFRHTLIKNLKAGFTLIELMVVVTIISLLVTAGAVVYTKVVANSRDAKRKADLEAVKNALVLYRVDNSYYPSSITWTSMAPINNYISVTSMSGPRGDSYVYTPAGCVSAQCKTFTVCATLENTVPASYCVNNP